MAEHDWPINLAMLRGVLDAVTEESVWVFDRECTVLFANQLALQRLGRRAEEVVGLPASDFLLWGTGDPLALIRDVFETGEPLHFTDEHDGTVFHHRMCPVNDEAGRVSCVACFSRDVTVQKRTEDALRLSEEKYSKAFATNPAAISMTTLEDGRFLAVNDTWVELLGFTREEALGVSALRMRIWQTPESAQLFRKELEEKGALHDWEQEFLKKSGERFIAQVSAQILTVAGKKVILSTVVDVTARRRADDALRQSAERYERQMRLFEGVTSTTPDFVYVFDPQGRFLYANRRLLEVWGMRLPEVIGKTCRELGYEQWHHDMHMREIAEVTETKRPIKGEVPFKAPLTGIFGVYEYIFTPVLGPDGEVELIAGTTRDVTERKHAEEALRQAHDELESRVAERTALLQNTVRELHEKEHLLLQQSRLAAMGEMINNIAHQWRQPLNTLGLLLQRLGMLKDAGALSDTVIEETAEQAMGLIRHMSRTIDDFRNFFKPDKGQVGFRLGEVVGTAIHLVEAAFQSHQISMQVEQKDDPVVQGYPSEYAQVVLNILNNAKDAFEARRIKERRVHVTFGTAGQRSFLTVRDNAGGVPEEIVTKIFEPHFTTKGTHGTGIGLFMSKNIIEKNMSGRISVRNTGDGAEFTIEV